MNKPCPAFCFWCHAGLLLAIMWMANLSPSHAQPPAPDPGRSPVRSPGNSPENSSARSPASIPGRSPGNVIAPGNVPSPASPSTSLHENTPPHAGSESAKPGAFLQASLRQGRLIQSLAEQGMRTKLLELQRKGTWADPAQQSWAQAQLRWLDFRKQLAPPRRRSQATRCLRQAMDLLEHLIAQYPAHICRALWQGCLGRWLILDKLGTLDSGELLFAEFGMFPAERVKALQQKARHARDLLESAGSKQQTQDVRNRFALAYADYIAAGMSGHWSTLSDFESEAQGGVQHPVEAQRLTWLKQADQQLRFLLQSEAAGQKQFHLQLVSLLGRVNSALGQWRKAEALFRREILFAQKAQSLKHNASLRGTSKVISGDGSGADGGSGDEGGETFGFGGRETPGSKGTSGARKTSGGGMAGWITRLAWATVLHRLEREMEAYALLESLEALSKQHIADWRRLLLAQTHWRLRCMQAWRLPPAQRVAAVRKSYDIYARLGLSPLSDSNNRSPSPLQRQLYQSWAQQVDRASQLRFLPDAVLASVGQVLRQQGQNEALENQPAFHARLAWAITANRALLKRSNVAPALRDKARFNLAMSSYYQNRNQSDAVLAAATQLKDLTLEHPASPMALPAITSALAMLQTLRTASSAAMLPEINQRYERAMELLLRFFPTSQAADDQRVAYARDILIPAKKYARARQVLKLLPRNHPRYFDAQRLVLDCLAAEGLTQPLCQAAEQLRRDLDTAKQSSPLLYPRHTLLHAQCQALLYLAQNQASQSQWDQALAFLENLEVDFAEEPTLLMQALTLRLKILSDADRLAQAGTQAQAMLKRFTGQAAPAIYQLLVKLDQKISQQQAQSMQRIPSAAAEQLTRRIHALAQISVNISQSLLTWASTHGMREEDLIHPKRLMARAYRAMGQFNETLAILQPLAQQFDRDVTVLNELAQTHFQIGTPLHLRKALTLDRQLIEGFMRSPTGRDSPWYWQAWVRYLQSEEQLHASPRQIVLSIRRLKAQDPQLGGSPYREQLTRLQNKYAPLIDKPGADLPR